MDDEGAGRSQELTFDRPRVDDRMPTLWDRLWDPAATPTYWLKRFCILRLLGLVYFVGFWTLVNQGLPLPGSDGLLPAVDFLDRLAAQLGSTSTAFLRAPTLFWLSCSDGLLTATAWIGTALSLVVLFGYDIWRRRFGSDPDLVGRTVELDGVAHTVLGVLPPIAQDICW